MILKTVVKYLASLLKANLVLVLLAVAVIILFVAGSYKFAVHNHDVAARKQTHCSVTACVTVNKHATQSQVITVTSGSYVQFNNADGDKHDIMLVHSGVQHEDPSRYESGDFGAGEAWKVQFKQDGSYTFADKYNQNIEISVVVYTPGKDYKVQ